MEDTFPLRLRSRFANFTCCSDLYPKGIVLSTLGGGGVSLDGLKTSSTVAELQKLIQLKSLISPADQKSTSDI
jgi:hypothetical protein